MTQTTDVRAVPRAGYRHEVFLWHGLDAFVERTAAFVTEAVDSQTPIMVALTAARADPLRGALGDRASAVQFVDMTTLGHNPARLIPAWADFIAANGGGTRPLRGIGEPIWAGRRDAEVAECLIHEAVLNVAVPSTTPLWLLCPYDADALAPHVLDDARRSHPAVAHGSGGTLSDGTVHDGTVGDGTVSDGTVGADHLDALSLSVRVLSPPPPDARALHFGEGDLAQVRRLVEHHAAAAGVVADRVGELVLGVNEVAANSLDHGGGSGLLRTWVEHGALVFEITDAGRIVDPLVGRVTPRPAQPRGRGLWMVNRLCDLVQIRSTPTGTVIRVLTWL